MQVQGAEELEDQAVKKRGRLKDLREANRIYDAQESKEWETKYHFFSGKHMKHNFRLHVNAMHDPFNKQPDWGKSILQRVAHAATSKGLAPEDLFRGVDFYGDGGLDRAEMRKVVLSVLPTLSDQELTAIFDYIDEDKTGEVDIEEFSAAIREGVNAAPVDAKLSHKWRNPIRRINRIPPASIEGWDHLRSPPEHKSLSRLCDVQCREVMKRLSGTLGSTDRRQQGRPGSSSAPPKGYQYFAGGLDTSGRFCAKYSDRRSVTDIPDPGPFVKPGWHWEVHNSLSASTQMAPLVPGTPRTQQPHTAR